MVMCKIDFRKEIAHLMEEYLGEFDLNYEYIKESRYFYVCFRNLKTNRSINFIAHSYSEIFNQLVMFEIGYDYSRV